MEIPNLQPSNIATFNYFLDSPPRAIAHNEKMKILIPSAVYPLPSALFSD